MVSRSNSTYLPLAQAASGETMTPAVPKRNFSEHNDVPSQIQTMEDKGINEEENHEARRTNSINSFYFCFKTNI